MLQTALRQIQDGVFHHSDRPYGVTILSASTQVSCVHVQSATTK